MAGLIRKYETKEDCVKLFVSDFFNCFDSSLITYDYEDEWLDHWSFMESEPDYDDLYDEEELEEARGNNELFMVGIPMWNTWFEIADSFAYRMIEEKANEVADIGFTLIYHDDELWGLGINGAGYDFYGAHWIPLYDLLGMKWHE